MLLAYGFSSRKAAPVSPASVSGVESPYAWARLAASLLLATIGGVGMWSVVVVLPSVQAEFGVDRAAASIPYTAGMIGFAVGGVFMGKLGDRFGIVTPVALSAVSLALGYIGAGLSPNIWLFALMQGLLIGFFGCAAVFSPLVADISHWFDRRRGLAVGIAASGNYAAGTVWPPVIQNLIDTIGWRYTYIAIGLTCIVTMLPLALVLRRPSPRHDHAANGGGTLGRLPISTNALLTLLIIAGITCCLAMAMPQVHIVAYCGDLGYGVARGAEMLSIMLGFGVVSRLASGWISDRIGGVRTLLLGSTLQMATLCLYLPFDGLMSLYVVSALFGLAQGGIVPSYAIIIREYMPASEAGTRVGIVMMATIIGMAAGGWVSGAIFDWTGSYRIAFLNGIAWNMVNAGIALWLLFAGRRRFAPA
ncbi:MAG: MFS transporter [Alphaproteobacteria bacterium]|nr:MFS transporter [Alphaproteobacteria bacterium]